uniref:F-box-like family protein n=1 Tax=Pithovirus LCPAC406 TaxID=2506599 RepID=A0A481ZDN7_9VIRU|nr:MAG: uncharacterized protein LCPAC406_03870 [Pithovirus LCPAC406]
MNSTSSDSLQTIFTYLDVGEISRKSLTNHLFNNLCSSEVLNKIKLSEDYSIVEKEEYQTWRSRTKEIYLESISFWKNIDDDIDYYVNNIFGTEDIMIRFEKRLIDHALREGKEFFTIELIFKEFFDSYFLQSIDPRRICKNFISLLEKVASSSPKGKMSIKWMLDLIVDNYQETRISYHSKIEVLVRIYLEYNHLFMNDVDSIEWKVELEKQYNLLSLDEHDYLVLE